MEKYNHKEIETKIQKFWKQNHFFKDANSSTKPTFSILMPPPNVTGRLHLGHAWDLYYPDTLIRYKQLKGFNSIWFPGMDHAGIATQAKVEEKLLKEKNLTRFQLGREVFLKQAWEWKHEYASEISKQWDKIGIAINEEKSKFTLDDDMYKLVVESFVNLYKQGLIYRDNKIVNWDSTLQTVISDIEVETKETKQNMYEIKYMLKNSNDYIVVSTTRPETIYGDVAIFVHPNDERYTKFHNKIAINPLNGKETPILLDDYIDVEFGSGAMKCTPGHDFNDFKLGKKHNLEFINILNNDGTFNHLANEIKGKNVKEARKFVVNLLEQKNLLVNVKEHNSSVGYSQRTGVVVEPKLSLQWFLKSSELAKLSQINQHKDSKVVFYPERFETTFLNWVENMEDWCVSRQLWWGHRIPAWYKGDEVKVQIESPGNDWKQDEDVLDTWYSSALWPLIFKDEKIISNSKNKNFLSDVLFTGYDIILFWVSRMIFQSLKLDGRPPFKFAIIHGLIRDAQGRKMSKSLGNGIDPMDMIEKYGSDALRMFLLGSSTPGNDIKFNVQKMETAWEFSNKLFNSFNLIKILSSKYNKKFEVKSMNNLKLSNIDKFVLIELNNLIEQIDLNLEKYNLTVIFSLINKFVYTTFSSYYLELVKAHNDENQIESLVNIFKQILIVLHPFAPFVTEKIYQEMNLLIDVNKSILLEHYPNYLFINDFDKHTNDIMMALLSSARKADSNPEYKNTELQLFPNFALVAEYFEKYLKPLMNVKIVTNWLPTNIVGMTVNPGVGIIYYSFDTSKLKSRNEVTENEKKVLEAEYNRAKKILENENFVKNATEEVINAERSKLEFYRKALDLILHREAKCG